MNSLVDDAVAFVLHGTTEEFFDFLELSFRVVDAIKTYATEHDVPLVPFESGQDKDAIVATYRAKCTARDGVVMIGVAQEEARAFKAHKRCGPQGGVTFDFTRQSVAVNH
jgi:hypothetical protein